MRLEKLGERSKLSQDVPLLEDELADPLAALSSDEPAAPISSPSFGREGTASQAVRLVWARAATRPDPAARWAPPCAGLKTASRPLRRRRSGAEAASHDSLKSLQTPVGARLRFRSVEEPSCPSPSKCGILSGVLRLMFCGFGDSTGLRISAMSEYYCRRQFARSDRPLPPAGRGRNGGSHSDSCSKTGNCPLSCRCLLYEPPVAVVWKLFGMGFENSLESSSARAFEKTFRQFCAAACSSIGRNDTKLEKSILSQIIF